MTDWKAAEATIRDRLGLEETAASGNKWYDIGDSADHSHFSQSVFPLLVESKATINKSYSINRDYVQDYWEKATMRGKRFLLHTQFQDREGQTSLESVQRDWVTITLDDFTELYELAQRGYSNPVKDDVHERTQEEDVAINMIELLFQHIGDTDTRVKYYHWWDLIKPYLPSTEVQS